MEFSFSYSFLLFFFFTYTTPTEIYTLSLHDALPISVFARALQFLRAAVATNRLRGETYGLIGRSEEHTSELQSRGHLVCRLLLEKKNEIRPLSPFPCPCSCLARCGPCRLIYRVLFLS